jgi:hypothetical protein
MAIELNLSLKDDDARVQRMGAILGVEGEELPMRLAALAGAALTEYMLAFTGERAPSTIRDQRELRLRLLYEHFPAGEPTELQLARLFQMTPPQVGTLIAGTRARYGDEVGARMRAEAIGFLRGGTPINEDTLRIRVDDSMGRYLKDLVAQTSAPPVEKRRDASRTYDLGRDTIEALCGQLGIDPTEVLP